MSDRLRESVSALVDGEASEMELQRVLANANNAEVRDCWRAYQLTRGALSGDSLQFAHVDLSARISAVLEHEGVPAAAAVSRRLAWRKPAGGLAVAATVAAVVVMGGQMLRSGDEAAPLADAARGRVFPASVATTPASGETTVSSDFSGLAPAAAVDPDQEAGRQLDKLLLQHTERAVIGSGKGTIPYARLPAVDQYVEEQ